MGKRLTNGLMGIAHRAGNALVATLVGAATIPANVAAADVYVSRATDGTVRYASAPVDSSYVLLFRDEPGAAVVLPAAQAPRPATLRLQPLIDQAALRHGVPAELVQAVIGVESGFNPAAVSPKGARGAMQLMPATGRRYGLKQPEDFDLAERNIDAGVRHLKDLLVLHGGSVPLALAAYNAGSGAVQRHGNRIPPYPETMLYVPAVLSRAHRTTQP
ncbi:MAG TPA: lytic transglycosylase domain-containing protein [Ramlibacter sp.]